MGRKVFVLMERMPISDVVDLVRKLEMQALSVAAR